VPFGGMTYRLFTINMMLIAIQSVCSVSVFKELDKLTGLRNRFSLCNFFAFREEVC
jgi:hypothetical protein